MLKFGKTFCEKLIEIAALFAIRQRKRTSSHRVRRDPLAILTDKEIIEEYRMTMEAILEICSLLETT